MQPVEKELLGKQVGQNVLLLCARARISPAELQAKVEMSKRAVRSIEKGERLPRFRNLLRLASALEAGADELVEGIEWRPPPEAAFFVMGKRVGD